MHKRLHVQRYYGYVQTINVHIVELLMWPFSKNRKTTSIILSVIALKFSFKFFYSNNAEMTTFSSISLFWKIAKQQFSKSNYTNQAKKWGATAAALVFATNNHLNTNAQLRDEPFASTNFRQFVCKYFVKN